MMYIFLKKLATRGILSIIVCTLVFAPFGYDTRGIHRQEAEAVTVPVIVVGGPGTAADIKSAIALASLVKKEFVLDNIVFVIINTILSAIIRSVTQWVQSGFEGSPAFVTDLKGFLLNIADEQAGNFIYGTELGVLCSPFELDIRAALAIQYFGNERNFENTVQCRLSDAVQNVEDFLGNGNFFSGGWDGWFELSQNPQNNPYGALVLAQAQMSVRIRNAQGREIKLLDFGEGFFSFKVCSEVEGGGENCTVSTPGAVIEDQVNRVFGLENDRLLIADELNELLGALLNQLVQKILTGSGGLLGVDTGGFKDPSVDFIRIINSAIGDESRWVTLTDSITVAIDEAEEGAKDACPPVGVALPASLVTNRNLAIADAQKTRDVIADLQSLRERIPAAINDPDALSTIANEYQDLSTQFHDDVDFDRLRAHIEDNRQAIQDYNRKVQEACSAAEEEESGGGEA